MPRRISDYPDAFAGWNYLSSFGSIISVVAAWLFLHIVYLQLVEGKASGRNPWMRPQFYSDILQALLNRSSPSLEWGLTSPPKAHSFTSLPQQSLSNKWILACRYLLYGWGVMSIIVGILVLIAFINNMSIGDLSNEIYHWFIWENVTGLLIAFRDNMSIWGRDLSNEISNWFIRENVTGLLLNILLAYFGFIVLPLLFFFKSKTNDFLSKQLTPAQCFKGLIDRLVSSKLLKAKNSEAISRYLGVFSLNGSSVCSWVLAKQINANSPLDECFLPVVGILCFGVLTYLTCSPCTKDEWILGMLRSRITNSLMWTTLIGAYGCCYHVISLYANFLQPGCIATLEDKIQFLNEILGSLDTDIPCWRVVGLLSFNLYQLKNALEVNSLEGWVKFGLYCSSIWIIYIMAITFVPILWDFFESSSISFILLLNKILGGGRGEDILIRAGSGGSGVVQLQPEVKLGYLNHLKDQDHLPLGAELENLIIRHSGDVRRASWGDDNFYRHPSSSAAVVDPSMPRSFLSNLQQDSSFMQNSPECDDRVLYYLGAPRADDDPNLPTDLGETSFNVLSRLFNDLHSISDENAYSSSYGFTYNQVRGELVDRYGNDGLERILDDRRPGTPEGGGQSYRLVSDQGVHDADGYGPGEINSNIPPNRLEYAGNAADPERLRHCPTRATLTSGETATVMPATAIPGAAFIEGSSIPSTSFANGRLFRMIGGGRLIIPSSRPSSPPFLNPGAYPPFYNWENSTAGTGYTGGRHSTGLTPPAQTPSDVLAAEQLLRLARGGQAGLEPSSLSRPEQVGSAGINTHSVRRSELPPVEDEGNLRGRPVERRGSVDRTSSSDPSRSRSPSVQQGQGRPTSSAREPSPQAAEGSGADSAVVRIRVVLKRPRGDDSSGGEGPADKKPKK